MTMTREQYAPPPPGGAPFPPLEVLDEPPARVPIRNRLLTLDQLGKLPPVRPLVGGLLYRATLAQIAGEPGCYKSFAAIGIACAVALGENWEGHHVPEAGPVIYVAAEGANGLRARVHAWCHLSGVDPRELEGRLLFLPEPVQLGNHLDVSEARAAAVDLEAHLVVLDTRARCTLGLKENDSTDQGLAIEAAEKIKRDSGATVLAVHHSARGGQAGRGSNAWDGAVWSDLRMAGEDGTATITCAKHKDVPAGCEHRFRMVPHTVPEELMPGCDVRQRSTLVTVQYGDLDDSFADRKSARVVLDVVRTMGGLEGLTRSQIRELAEEAGVKRSSAYAAINDLVRGAALRNIGSEARPRYVLTGGQMHLAEPA